MPVFALTLTNLNSEEGGTIWISALVVKNGLVYSDKDLSVEVDPKGSIIGTGITPGSSFTYFAVGKVGDLPSDTVGAITLSTLPVFPGKTIAVTSWNCNWGTAVNKVDAELVLPQWVVQMSGYKSDGMKAQATVAFHNNAVPNM